MEIIVLFILFLLFRYSLANFELYLARIPLPQSWVICPWISSFQPWLDLPYKAINRRKFIKDDPHHPWSDNIHAKFSTLGQWHTHIRLWSQLFSILEQWIACMYELDLHHLHVPELITGLDHDMITATHNMCIWGMGTSEMKVYFNFLQLLYKQSGYIYMWTSL